MKRGDKVVYPVRRIRARGPSVHDRFWTVAGIEGDELVLTHRNGRTVRAGAKAHGLRSPTAAEKVRYKGSW